MPVTIATPTAGTLQIIAGVQAGIGSVVLPAATNGVLQIIGAIALTPLPSGTTIAAPSGKIPLLGAMVVGYLDGSGNFQQGFAP